MDERATVSKLQNEKLGVIEGRPHEEKDPTDIEKTQLDGYRARAKDIDTELAELDEQLAREQASSSAQKDIRARIAGEAPGIELENGAIKYQTFATYARDYILARANGNGFDRIRSQVGREVVEAARERLARAPEHTLSADVLGLQPDQHIAQIFQVIDDSRPLVASALRVPLDRGSVTFPKITGKPTVADQGTEKTVASTPDLNVTMETATATTYNAGGNLSWQAINWTTPSALDLWFRVAAADYALQTETDAGNILEDSGFANIVTDELTGSPTYEEYVTAIAQGAAEVYSASGRMADTIYFAPDEFYKFAALIPVASAAAFLSGGVSLNGGGSFAGLKIVKTRGLSAGVAVVGDAQGLLCAESPGAPVELRAVEAQIGGLEVGIIGAFEAVVVDEGAFSLITAAS
jgi:hypothetical protein